MKSRKLLTSLLVVGMLSSMMAIPTSADTLTIGDSSSVEEVVMSGYNVDINGDTFTFNDYDNGISIVNGTLKNGKDISYYGLNNDGNLATVYYNAVADEGKAVVITNDSMKYIYYSNGSIKEVDRAIGTLGLFNFDLSVADSSMAGMMKVFNASLFSFMQSYQSSLADYSAISNYSNPSGKVEYVRGPRTMTLSLYDDNYMTNNTNNDEAFMANEWGIYTGYQVYKGVDYATFCFFGDSGDVYYFGYAITENGYKVLALKGNVAQVNDRTKTVKLSPVDLTRTSDDASQYVCKMMSSLLGAQMKTSLNLDTIEITPKRGALSVKTSTASGTLSYSKGVYTGDITDANGNSETLTIKRGYYGKYIVTSQTSGTFTVDSTFGYGSLADDKPVMNNSWNDNDYWLDFGFNHHGFWWQCWGNSWWF